MVVPVQKVLDVDILALPLHLRLRHASLVDYLAQVRRHFRVVLACLDREGYRGLIEPVDSVII